MSTKRSPRLAAAPYFLISLPRFASLFAALRRRLPQTQIVSITHDAALAGMHPRHLALTPNVGERPEAFT